MIQITRTGKPNVLELNAENWTEEYLKAKEKYTNDSTQENKKAFERIEKRYNNLEVKDALKIMFKKKCAFCESHITHVDYGQIEHFKPKSKYPELCFEWKNFLLSCAICNGAGNKGNKFPLEADGGPFVNPIDEIPEDFFKFEYDKVTKSFMIFPKNRRALTTIKNLGLNRDDLAENRTNELSKIIYILEKVLGQNEVEVFNNFINLFSAKDQYFAFIKTIFAKVKI